MKLTEEKITQLIAEELSKSDINSMISSKIDTNMRSRDFKKAVKEVAAEVVSEFCRLLWQRNSFWKSSLSK
jgi:hypothetical protein